MEERGEGREWDVLGEAFGVAEFILEFVERDADFFIGQLVAL